MEHRLETKRKMIMDVYPGIRWKDRVSKMKPAQVCAVYNSFEKSGRFKKKKKEKEECYQMTIYDYIWSDDGVKVR